VASARNSADTGAPSVRESPASSTAPMPATIVASATVAHGGSNHTVPTMSAATTTALMMRVMNATLEQGAWGASYRLPAATGGEETAP